MPEKTDSEIVQYCFTFLNDSCIREQSGTKKAVLYFLISVLIAMTIGGNMTVITAITHFRQLHSPTNFLILSLAFGDFLVGAIVMPFSMINTVENCWYFGDIFCFLSASFEAALTTISILHLIFIAVDRYFAICDPLLYNQKITNSVISMFIAFSWVAPQAYAYSFVFYNLVRNTDGIVVSKNFCTGSCIITWTAKASAMDASVSFFIPCSVMLGLYVRVFLVARQHSKLISIMEHGISGKEMTSTQRKEGKAAKTLTIVMGMFLFCWLPIFVVLLVDPYIEYSTPVMLYNILLWLAYSNSAYNPIVYAFFYPWFQKALKLMVAGKIFNKDSSSADLFSELN
ncbi:trace amine-associated receptor 4-like [Protopterus annectens]|uniref:trace amine-associated receptor 4-like n=1 Tax=Protopterus annectens TaxID=7888 RepID=UPI001CF99669|nr:trace amine-associated receptor 4-like [Protopterus annectens]